MSDNLKSSSNAVLDRSLAIIGESSAKDLMDITRAGRNLEETENQQLEIAVNTRAIELSLTANPYALRHLGKAIANLLEPEQSSFAGENIGQGYLPAQHNQQGKFLHTTGSPESSGSDSSKTWKEVDLEYVFDLQSTNPSHPETFKYDSVLEKFTNKLAFVVDVYESKFDLPHTAVHGNIAYVTSLKQIRFYNGIEWLNLAGAYNQLQNWEVLIGQTHDPVSTVSIPWQSTTKYDFDGTTATLDQLLGGVIEAAPASRWSSNDREDQQLISTTSDDNISTTTYGTQFGDFTYETTRGSGGHEGTTQATGSVDENGITIRAPHWSWGEWTIYKTLNTGDEISVSGEYSSVHNAYGSVDLYLSKVDGTIRNIPQTSGYIRKNLRAEGSGTTTGTFNESLKSTQSGLHAITIRASNTSGGTATFNSLVISPGISNETVASVALPISENTTFEFDNTEVTGGEFISATKDPFTGTKGWSPRTVGDVATRELFADDFSIDTVSDYSIKKWAQNGNTSSLTVTHNSDGNLFVNGADNTFIGIWRTATYGATGEINFKAKKTKDYPSDNNGGIYIAETLPTDSEFDIGNSVDNYIFIPLTGSSYNNQYKKVVNGVEVDSDNVGNGSWNSSDYHDFKLEYSESQITLSMDDVVVFSKTFSDDTIISPTAIGLVFGQIDYHLDSFSVIGDTRKEIKPTVGSVSTNIFNDNAVFTYEGTERTDTGFLPKDNRWSLVVTPQPDASDMISGGLMSQRFDYNHSHTNLAIAMDTDLLTESGDRSTMSHMNPQALEVASEVSFTGGDVINRNYIAMGYFKAPTTGIFTFKLYADNSAALWFGEQAYPHSTDTKSTTNALLNVNGSWQYKAVSLEKDMFYPVMISYYDNGGTDSLQFRWFGPNIEETDDLTGHFHYYNDGSRFHVDQRSTFVGSPDEENTLFNDDTVYTMYGTEETTGQTIGGVFPALTESRWEPQFAQKSSRFNYSEGQRPLGDDSSYVSAPLGGGVNDTFTLEFWFKPNSDMTNKIVFQTGYPGIRILGDGYTQHRQPGSSHGYSNGSGVVVGEWNHYVFTREGNTHRVWINGQRKTTNNRTPQNAGGSNIHVGGYTSGDALNGFDGYITSVKITRGQNLYSEYENEHSFVPQGQPISDDVPFTLEIDGVASIWNEQLPQTGNSEGTIFSPETAFTWEGTVVTGGLRIGGGAGADADDTDSIWSLYPQAESENDVQRISGNTDYGWFTDGARPFDGTLTTEGETIGGYITESNSIWNAREFYESENEIQRIAGNTDYGWFTDGARPFDGTLTTEGEVIGGYDIPDPSFWAYSTVEESENTVQRLSESDGFFTTVDGSLASSNIRIGALNSYDTSSIWSSRDLNESKLIAGHSEITEASDVYFLDIDGTTTTDGTVIGGELVDEIGDNTLSTWSLGEDFTSVNRMPIISGGFGGYILPNNYKSWQILMRADGTNNSKGYNFGYIGQGSRSSFRDVTAYNTSASSRTSFGHGLGFYDQFFKLKDITKVALVSGDGIDLDDYNLRGENSTIKTNEKYAIYSIADTGNRTLAEILGDIDYNERYGSNWADDTYSYRSYGYHNNHWSHWWYNRSNGANGYNGHSSTTSVMKSGRSGDLEASQGMYAPNKFSVYAKFDPYLPHLSISSSRYTNNSYKNNISAASLVFHNNALDWGGYSSLPTTYTARSRGDLGWFLWYNPMQYNNNTYAMSNSWYNSSYQAKEPAGPAGLNYYTSSYGKGVSYNAKTTNSGYFNLDLSNSNTSQNKFTARLYTWGGYNHSYSTETLRFYNPNDYDVTVTISYDNAYWHGYIFWNASSSTSFSSAAGSYRYNNNNSYQGTITSVIPANGYGTFGLRPNLGSLAHRYSYFDIQFGSPDLTDSYDPRTEKSPEYLMGYGSGAYIPLVETDDEFMLYENREPELSGILSEYTIPHTGSLEISPTISDYEDSYVEMDFDYEILSGDLGDASVVIDDSGNISISRGNDDVECTLRFTLTDSRGGSIYTDTTLTYINLPPVVDSHNIESSYELVDGQDLFIAYPNAVDPEGDDVTWSYQIGQYDESRMTGEHKRSVTVSADDTGVTITPNGTWAAFGLTLSASDDVGRTVDITTQISYNIGIAPPVWLSPAAGDLLDGEEYNLGDSIDHTFNTLSITGDPIGYTLVDGWSLPDGITILADGSFDGVISAPASGNYAFTVRATVNDGENYPYTDREFFVNVSTALFDFSSHTFTSLRRLSSNDGWNSTGKALTDYRNSYSTNFDDNLEFFNVINGVQFWKVPKTGTYNIVCVGAQGGNTYHGNNGGQGAYITGQKNLSEGQILRIVVGGHGGGYYYNAGGGGASSVSLMPDATDITSNAFYTAGDLIVIAGGGGGGGNSGGDGKNASLSKYTNVGWPNYKDSTSYQLAGYGYRGNQNGGWGTGGAGWNYDGTGKIDNGSWGRGINSIELSSATPYGASSTLSTSGGGTFISSSYGSCNGAAGGFGGGGSGACNGGGGGGGWSGGPPGGGGGSSYTDGLDSVTGTSLAARTTGFQQQLSHGYVDITFVSS